MTARRFITYPAARERFERAYWRVLARCPDAVSFREAARLAGVTASTVVRKFQEYRLHLKHGRR